MCIVKCENFYASGDDSGICSAINNLLCMLFVKVGLLLCRFEGGNVGISPY